MTDREKLIELLAESCRKRTHCSEDCCKRNREHCKSDFADHLLANGVTFAKDTAKNVTSIDTVEVVRCRDCRYRKTERCQMYWESEDGREQYNWETDDDFCSSGKRRDEHSWKR